MEYFVEHYTYAAVIVLLLLGGFGVPIPEDIPLILSGYICYAYPEHVDLWVMVPVAFGAVMMGDLIMYTLGRKWGDRVTQIPMFRRYLTTDRLAKAQLKFHEHGGKALFIARFLPGLRSATFFSAGLFKIPAWKMIAFDGLAALLSVPALVIIPYHLAQFTAAASSAKGIADIKKLLGSAQTAVLALLALAVVFYYIYHRLRARRNAAAAPQTDAPTTPQPPVTGDP